MSKPAPKRPKPLSKEEFDHCVAKIGHPEMEIRRWIGLPSVAKGRQVRPAEFTLMQARACRMFAVYPEILAKFLEVRKHFPAATIDAIRPLLLPGQKAGS